MSRPVSLFSGYSQKENRVTNYCLLVLKMLYEENPKYLGEVLATIVGEDLSGHVGVTFRQQERRESSVPDGLIVQQPFTIYIETKNYDWFDDAQLESHLSSLNNEVIGQKILIALGNFESHDAHRFRTVNAICDSKYRNTIVFRVVTFEALISALAIQGLSKNLADAIEEFRNFLNEEDLLPSWRDRLDVVNCAGIPEDIIEGGVYMCPAEGGAYTHTRCHYFGMYRNKRVELIGEIQAVVDVDPDVNTSRVKWKNTQGKDVDFEARAKSIVHDRRNTDGPTRVFLLGQLFESDFRKDTPGGMQSSKRYFNIALLKPQNAANLAQLLKGRFWSEFL
jgi:hypothetical protein